VERRERGGRCAAWGAKLGKEHYYAFVGVDLQPKRAAAIFD
jgi:hypothetical protein